MTATIHQESHETETTAGADAGPVLRMTRRFAAPREAVFDAFTDVKQIMLWWGPEGFDVPEADLDPRTGGAWRICMRTPNGEVFCVGGVYREFVRPERLVLTWAWESDTMADVETLVTLEFDEMDGGTELRLLHEGFPRPEARDKHQEGWTGCFASVTSNWAI